MMKKNIRFITVTVIFAVIIVFIAFLYNILMHKHRRKHAETIQLHKQQHTQLYKQLYIENYIFTKLSSGKALIRIYGVNKSDKEIDHFPVVIKYYTKTGRYIGKDEPDLLSRTKTVLKAGGKLNAKINVAYPENTDKVKVEINPR